MFNVVVEWLDPDKTRARFSLPGRTEWRAEHLEALIQLLAQIREDMSPPVGEEPPAVHSDPLHNPYAADVRIRITDSLSEQEKIWQRSKK